MFQGKFTTTGIDLKKLEELNVPKVFFYGKYKYILKFKNGENKILGCFAIEITLLRPWEKLI